MPDATTAAASATRTWRPPSGGHARGWRTEEMHMKRAALSMILVAAFYPGTLAQTTTPATAIASVTFSKDIAPILQKACQNCHRPGAIAPMSLLTYQDAR